MAWSEGGAMTEISHKTHFSKIMKVTQYHICWEYTFLSPYNGYFIFSGTAASPMYRTDYI